MPLPAVSKCPSISDRHRMLVLWPWFFPSALVDRSTSQKPPGRRAARPPDCHGAVCHPVCAVLLCTVVCAETLEASLAQACATRSCTRTAGWGTPPTRSSCRTCAASCCASSQTRRPPGGQRALPLGRSLHPYVSILHCVVPHTGRYNDGIHGASHRAAMRNAPSACWIDHLHPL